MASFDRDKWREKAETRCKNAISSGTLTREEAKKLQAKDDAFINKLGIVVEWCERKGVDVEFCAREAGAFYLPDDKHININSRLSFEKQLYFILHECGHHLISAREKRDRFEMGNVPTNSKFKKTFHHRCDVVDEELEAWYRGWKLAKRLGLGVSKTAFNKEKITQLKTYFKWALRPSAFESASDVDDKDNEKSVARR